MPATSETTATPSKPPTTVERKSDRELLVTRTMNAPARLVFDAFTNADLFRKWWVPKSFGIQLLSCEVDARVGGGYRLVFAAGENQMAFFGKYLEVVPSSRLVWTNEEGPDGAVTTLTLEEKGGQTVIRLLDVYSSKEALDAGAGDKDGMGETFAQLEEILGVGTSRV